jgi:hypothetical protein
MGCNEEPLVLPRRELSDEEKVMMRDNWLKESGEFLDAAIAEFNIVSEEAGQDVIVAFRMTVEERDDFLSSINLEGGSE